MKSVAVGVMLALVIGAIILIVLLPMMLKSAGKTWKEILKLEELLETQLNDVELAIVCSRLICTVDYDRVKWGCPVFDSKSFFVKKCVPWLEERGLYKEVCTLPTLFKIDPCAILSLPINASAETGSSTVAINLIQNIVKSETKKETVLVKLGDDRYEKDKGLVYTFLKNPSVIIWKGKNAIGQDEYVLENRLFLPNSSIEQDKGDNTYILTPGNYYAFTFSLPLKEVTPISENELEYYYTAIMDKPNYIFLSDNSEVTLKIKHDLYVYDFCPDLGVKGCYLIRPYYLRIVIGDEYNATEVRSYNYFIRIDEIDKNHLKMTFMAYYLNSNTLKESSFSFSSSGYSKKEFATNKGKLTIEFKGLEASTYYVISFKYKKQ